METFIFFVNGKEASRCSREQALRAYAENKHTLAAIKQLLTEPMPATYSHGNIRIVREDLTDDTVNF